MQSRFLALIGPKSAGAECGSDRVEDRVRQWGLSRCECLVGEGVELFTQGNAIALGHDGLVLGTLFEADAAARVSRFSGPVVREIIATEGEALLRRCWGGYVAICRSRNGAIHILRDPSGTVPCYYAQLGNRIAITSNIRFLTETGLLEPELDWSMIAGHLVATDLRPERTALIGVKELLGGFRLSMNGQTTTLTQRWSPWSFAGKHGLLLDLASAVEAVRDVTRRSVEAWASTFHHVLLGLSGGLDSSIVAACLAWSRTPFSCLTVMTHEARGDERPYARLVADRLGVPLLEAFEDPDAVDLSRSDASHLPRPNARAFAQSSDQMFAVAADQVGADGYFNGGGGDNIFCYIQSVAPAADRLLVEGAGRGLLRTARDISQLAEADMGTVVSRAARRAWLRRPDYRWPKSSTFLSEKALSIAPAPAHPWLEAPKGALPGKAAHIAWILGIQNHLEGFARGHARPIISPLLSQPMMETCLRVPSWMWCDGGRNRAVARAAFAPDLPAAIIERRTKGTPLSFVMELFEGRSPEIAELLLGGELAEQGLIDVTAIEEQLRKGRAVRTTECMRIMQCVDVEAWVRSWTSRAPRRAVASNKRRPRLA